MTAQTATAAGTTRPRQPFPDQLRGLALLGIVVVNVPFLGTSLAGFGAAGGTSSRAAEFVVTLLAQGKFYLVFAFLFGYSAALMLRDGEPSAVRGFGRRLAGLAAIGVAHALLFFIGDILVVYAVMGIAVLLLARRSERTVLRVAVASASLTAVWLAAVVALAYTFPGSGADPAFARYDAAMTGTFTTAVAGRWEVYGVALVLLGTLNAGLSLTMFCLGLVAGRRGLLTDPAGHPALWRRARRWGLALGVPGALAASLLTLGPADPAAAAAFQAGGRYTLGIVVGFATAPALAAGYLGLLAALATRWPAALAVFGPAGRMSLTLYLGESVLLSAVFCGWGLGLFGRLDAFAVLGVGVATWLVLDLFSHLWLRWFRQGPVEFGLRWWTHGRRPAMWVGRPPPQPQRVPAPHA